VESHTSTDETAGSPARISVLIETDNTKRRGIERMDVLLSKLAQQVSELGEAVEVLIGHAGEFAPSWLEVAMRRSGLRGSASELRAVSVGTSGYYESKNRLASVASGDLLVFVDSDVIPSDDWLPMLLRPFEDPDVNIVGGRTIVGPLTSAWDKAVSATWFFDPTPREGIDAVSHFYANNVAMRSGFFRSHMYEIDSTEFRGACARLAQDLVRHDHVILRANDALCMHMSPSFLADVTAWYALTGSDYARSHGGDCTLGTCVSTTLQAFRGCTQALVRSVQRRSYSELDATSAIIAAFIALYGWSVWLIGAVHTLRSSDGRSPATSKVDQMPA
jgi:hypothetical protein